MPPIRTPTIKPVKTERTHEENQERAYIAASRRSDRSLEARIESARRASEIHKKRTGRALRVTEQDVVNEEMYEEEDDDLPAQYRRLQSHLQTGSFEFNRRLQAYMTSQMGTRNALMEQTMNGPYSNAPFFTNQFGQAQQPTMMNPQMLHYSNQGYRQAPYPMSSQNFSGMHNRAASISSPHDFANYVPNYPPTPTTPQLSNEEQHRRMSLPPQMPQAPGGMRPPVTRSASGVSLSDGTNGSPTSAAAGTAHGQQTSTGNGMGFPTTTASMFDASTQPMNNAFAPFSTSLPAETQQLLSQPAPMENSYNPYWFTGNSQPFSYSYKPNSRDTSPTEKPASSMDQTLSLNPLDTNVASHSPKSQGYVASATTDSATTPFSGTFSNYNFGGDGFFPDAMKDHNTTQSGSGRDSGVVTPNGADWTNFLEPFEDAGVSQS